MATAVEVIAKCLEHDHNSTFHDTAVCTIADLRRAGFALVRVPEIPFKGPHDTDGTLLIMAADRLEAGFRPGGSHVTQAVVRVIREVAAGAS